MTGGTLDDLYLTWLYSQVAEVRPRRSSQSYWDLFRQLYSTQFVWFVPNDDNRAEDGRILRDEWADASGVELDAEWRSLPCSFLELLVGLSLRLTFEADGEPSGWFWALLDNLELRGCHDRSNYDPEDVAEKINRVVWRTYDSRGHGGLFPLNNTTNDQRSVELWYQMSEYLLELA